MHRASQVPNRKITKGFNRTISIDGHVVNRKRPASTVSARQSNKRPQVRLTTAMSTLTLSQQNLGPQRVVQDRPSYTTRPSRPSSIVSDTYSETLRRFNAGDTFESKKYMPDTQSIKDPELQKQYLREITEYLKETSYEGPFIRSISMLGNREFQMIFKHLFLRIVPHYSYKRRFEEDAMVLIRQLGYPLADTINRKELLSIGAMHSNPTFIALLHWLVVVCKIMDTPRLSDDEVDEEIDEEAVAQLLHAYAIAGYHKYMTGDDDMASLDQELEHIFERANQPNLHQIEIYTKSISALEQELAQLESDNVSVSVFEIATYSVRENWIR
ncbi:HEC/Ndc80p family-domain-containing protein [Gilbertella persicaria]|uniref:HEC/Ndc80p family-domain-containing protein n=1 Tax=Gilbertella persicaria TaxID=101096 RepID=UPI002220EC80|nr:HEC/Ndc80p family-domain-containing protein [Gilbertella persicaria]KAI8091380.1 HEC/Ndc80p family-domain-containing protein [Gilbertella persicaria]